MTMRLLVIECDPEAGKQLGRTPGIRVHRAETLCEGVRWLLLHAADAILVDARLPGLSGPGDLRPLGEVAGATSVVVVVGEPAAGLAETYRRHGLPTIPKPFDLDLLIRTLARLAAPGTRNT